MKGDNFYLRCIQNGKIIGRQSHLDDTWGYPTVVESLPSQEINGYASKEDAEASLKSFGSWTLYNLGPVSAFTFEVVRVSYTVNYEVV